MYETFRKRLAKVATKPSNIGKLSHKPPHVDGVDDLDRKMLRLLQEDASLSLAELAERVNLSTNACWRRVKKLEEDGIILRRMTVLDQVKLGYNVTAFVTVRATEHSETWLQQFAGAIARIPEIVECYRMTGEIDYLLKIVATDIAGYDSVYKRLIRSAKLADVTASLAMEEMKSGVRLPLG